MRNIQFLDLINTVDDHLSGRGEIGGTILTF